MSPVKFPIRRSNLKTIVDRFGGKLAVLADALEITEEGLRSILAGAQLDDQRMNHLNPKLMRAGLPDGWLERPNAELSDAVVAELERMAADSCEQAIEEYAEKLKKKDVSAVRMGPRGNTRIVSVDPHKEAEAILQRMSDNTTRTTENVKAFTKMNKKSTNNDEPQAAVQEVAQIAAPPAFLMNKHTNKLSRGVLSAGRSVTLNVQPAAAPQPRSRAFVVREAAISKEQHKHRTRRLELLLKDAPYGVKTKLWRDCLQRNPSYFGALKTETVLFRDSLAKALADSLGIDPSWFDSQEPLKPGFVNWELYPQAVKKREVSALTTSSARNLIDTRPEPEEATMTVPSQPAQAPVPPPARVKPEETGFTWKPAQKPVSQDSEGPLTKVLTEQITRLSKEGLFTEKDATNLLVFLLTSSSK